MIPKCMDDKDDEEFVIVHWAHADDFGVDCPEICKSIVQGCGRIESYVECLPNGEDLSVETQLFVPSLESCKDVVCTSRTDENDVIVIFVGDVIEYECTKGLVIIIPDPAGPQVQCSIGVR
jgi:hypothetical protein